MLYDRNYTSQTSERLADGTTIQYTRFWSAEEIAQRKAEEAAWESEQITRKESELAEAELLLIEAENRASLAANARDGVRVFAAQKVSELNQRVTQINTELESMRGKNGR